MAPLLLPEILTVIIEVPRGGMVKRRGDGSVDFVALPSPFNYGSVVGTVAADGDPLDAIVLGPRLPPGRTVQRRPLAVYGFVDRGLLDPKIVCGESLVLGGADRRAVERFFAVYSRFKRGLQRLRKQPERTEVLGWLRWTSRAP
ncbi:MAG: inorganic diphosphatase [Nannocystaceae bacterium]